MKAVRALHVLRNVNVDVDNGIAEHISVIAVWMTEASVIIFIVKLTSSSLSVDKSKVNLLQDRIRLELSDEAVPFLE